jgi:hypothetical protein
MTGVGSRRRPSVDTMPERRTLSCFGPAEIILDLPPAIVVPAAPHPKAVEVVPGPESLARDGSAHFPWLPRGRPIMNLGMQ